MKTIPKLSNSDLLQITKKLVEEERLKTLEVIEHIQEIYRRRIYLSLGYPSLHEFLVKELNYSDGAAHRRISAMRLLEDVPEVKAAIASGALSLSNASLVQGFFKTERERHKKTYSKEQKLGLLTRVESTTQDECRRELAQTSPTYAAHVKEIKIEEDSELIAMMDEFRQLVMLTDGSAKSVFKTALKTAIASLKAKRASLRSSNVGADRATTRAFTRHISASIKRVVWQRDQGRCSFINPRTKLRCGVRHKLEIDHILPFALGGETSVENLRLCCRAHNMLWAVEVYGKTKIDGFRKRV